MWIITVIVTHKKEQRQEDTLPSVKIQLTLPRGKKRTTTTVETVPSDGNKENTERTLTKCLTEDLKTRLKHIIFMM